MCSKRAVPFATLGRICLKGDVFFTQEVIFQDKVRFGERAPETILLGATGPLCAHTTGLGEGAFAAVLGINLDFGVTQITLHWLCGGCVSPRGCHCPTWQFLRAGVPGCPQPQPAAMLRALQPYSAEGCASMHPSVSFYLLIPLNIHQ